MPKISEETYAARRRHILDAARDRFARAGIHISIDEVCAAAGVSKGAFYGYFKSKDALFEALAQDHGELLVEQNAPIDRASLLAILAERLSIADPAYARVELDSWAYAMRHDGLKTAFARNGDLLRDRLVEVFAKLGARPGLTHASAAMILQFAAQGAFVHLALHGEQAVADIERSLDALVSALTDDADA